jgi:cell division septation protein DedD
MDNRDDDNTIDTASPNDERKGSEDKADSVQTDALAARAESDRDSGEADIPEFGGSERLRAESSEDEPEDDTTPAEAEKDWLVDSGLAAAIQPASPPSDDNAESEQDEDDDDWSDEDAEALDASDDSDLADDHDADEADDDDDDDIDDEGIVEGRPMWPTAVGLIAILLLAIGGWGLYEERTVLQTRVVELESNQARARSSNAIDPAEIAALETDNAALKLQLEGLYRDYEVAMEEIASLQALTSSETDSTPTADNNALDDTVADRGESLTESTSLDAAAFSVGAGDWFVNLGAYSAVASAENWLTRLQNAGYEATIQEVMVDADRILHRVRIDGFESKEAAQATATALEDEFGVSQLWVGQTPVDT